jgi:hypothetical protein
LARFVFFAGFDLGGGNLQIASQCRRLKSDSGFHSAPLRKPLSLFFW